MRIQDIRNEDNTVDYVGWAEAEDATVDKARLLEIHEAIKNCSVFTLFGFISACEDEQFNKYDGTGYYHDGEHLTNISVWDDTLSYEAIKEYPYVVWFNH